MDNSVNIIWTVISALLVLFMQSGFAMMETGFTRAKNAGHTVAMNVMVFVFALLGYWAAGYALQNGGNGFFLSGGAMGPAAFALFLSQTATMNVAATIPTGAMAERWTFKSFAFYAFFVAMIPYPLIARWIWGHGWLSGLGTSMGLGHGVLDLAGSSVVHLTGGAAGLAGAIVLGPRMGKFRADGTPTAMPGHNIPMAVVGCMFLFIGWFGLTCGSVLAADGSRIGLVAVNTMIASAAAACSAMVYMLFLYKKPDLSLSANALLGGLVAISASCAMVSPVGAAIIGAVAGVLCCASVFFVERKLRVDDPVGAVSVHGACGAWGMIALGLFADGTYGDGVNNVPGAVVGLFYGGASQVAAQVIGVVVSFLFIFAVMYLFFRVLDRLVSMRVEEEVEFEGLDQNEVSVTAYPDFSISKTRR